MATLLLTLFPVVASAVSLLALLLVIVRVKQRNKGEKAGVVESLGDSALVRALNGEVAELAKRVAGLESDSRELAGGPVRAGMNLSKRTQALRQHRLGQGPDTIAKSLDMTKAEVDLLLKVQQIVAR